MESSISIRILCNILLLYYIYDINQAALVSPTISNSSGEYYILSNDGNSNKQITCSHSSLCYIECLDTNSCESSTVNAAQTTNLILKCNGRYSCQTSSISNGPQIEANIFCTAYNGYACKQSTFFLNTTNIVNLNCDNDVLSPVGCSTGLNLGDYEHGGCYGVTLWAQNSEKVNVECSDYDCQRAIFHVESVRNKTMLTSSGEYGLYAAYIYGANAHELDINCNNCGACLYLEIFPPYQSEYVFSLYCVAEYHSCSAIDITIPKSYEFTDNYMELISPRTNRHTLGIRWYCEDLSGCNSCFTSTLYNSINQRFECNDADCCPWTDPNNMIKNTTNPAIIPQTILPTITNETGEYYILSSSTTATPIYCKNVEGCYIECNEQSSCDNAYIYAAESNYLTLICSQRNSCNKIYITAGSMIETNIYCTSFLGYACSEATFIMNETPIVNLLCDNDVSLPVYNDPYSPAINHDLEYGGCYSVALWAQNSEKVNVECSDYDCQRAIFHVESVRNKTMLTSSGEYGLYAAYIYGANAHELIVNCNRTGACLYLEIFPPYQSQWIFSLNCAAEYQSCSAIDITIPKSYTFTTNYMELICPDTK
eukprot:514130_1